MIKEYQSQQTFQEQNATLGGSIDFISNASTKDIFNQDNARVKKIFNEPIESLVGNLQEFSRP